MALCPRRFVGLSAVLLLAGCQEAAPPPVTPPAPTVTVSRPIAKDDVVDYEDFTGRTDAVSRVDIRARVNGYLVKVNFQDGDLVSKDQLLYQIDPRPFQATLDQANGQVERLEAEKKLLAIQVDRYQKLAVKGAAPQQDVDQYLAQQAENIGSLKAAEAQVALAKLNLDFTRVTAPVAGKISRTLLTEGNLVAADTTLLTTIMSIDPMYGYFNIEEPTMLRVQKMIRDGTIPSRDMHAVTVQMGLADDVEHKFPCRGQLDFVNNTVDPQTGTILVRAVFPNPYEARLPPVLTPGLFVRVRLPMGVPHQALLITERAIGTDQGQKYVYVLDSDDKAVYRRVKLGLMFDGLQSIVEGLQAGERVVVNGLQRVRAGLAVKAEETDMATLAAPAWSAAAATPSAGMPAAAPGKGGQTAQGTPAQGTDAAAKPQTPVQPEALPAAKDRP